MESGLPLGRLGGGLGSAARSGAFAGGSGRGAGLAAGAGATGCGAGLAAGLATGFATGFGAGAGLGFFAAGFGAGFGAGLAVGFGAAFFAGFGAGFGAGFDTAFLAGAGLAAGRAALAGALGAAFVAGFGAGFAVFGGAFLVLANLVPLFFAGAETFFALAFCLGFAFAMPASRAPSSAVWTHGLPAQRHTGPTGNSRPCEDCLPMVECPLNVGVTHARVNHPRIRANVCETKHLPPGVSDSPHFSARGF